ncbi:lysoplasmalogenase [Pseudomonas wadenswilerensis]
MSRSMTLFALALLGGALYIYALSAGSVLLALATKPVPVLALIFWLRAAPATTYRRNIILGLSLSIVGDLALAWPGDLFSAGLSAFLCAHLAYFWGYLEKTRKPAIGALLVAALCGTGLFSLLAWHGLGPLLIPVALYALTISAMLWRALACGGLAGIGAVSFVFSDSLIGIDRFVSPFAAAPYLIILFYWLGQWAIAASAQPVRSTGTLIQDATPQHKSV